MTGRSGYCGADEACRRAVYLDGVGTIRALNTVTVRSQVDGKLFSVNYTEGQQVDRGFVLAHIDPTT